MRGGGGGGAKEFSLSFSGFGNQIGKSVRRAQFRGRQSFRKITVFLSRVLLRNY